MQKHSLSMLSLSLSLSTDMYFLQKFKVQRQNISNNGF